VAEPDGPDPAGGNEDTFLFQFVGGAELPVGRLLDSKVDDRLLDVFLYPVPEAGLLPAYFLQRELSTFIIELLKPVEATRYLAGTCLRFLAALFFIWWLLPT
jgi:hypothetical protein